MMKKTSLVLSTFVLIALAIVALTVGSFADAQPTYTKTGLDSTSENVLYSPYLSGSSAKYDPQTGGSSYDNATLATAQAYANGTHGFYEFEFLMTDSNIPSVTAYLRSKAANVKTAIGSITSDGLVKVAGGGAGFQVGPGWHNVCYEFYQTHTLIGETLTVTLHVNAYVDSVGVESTFTEISTTSVGTKAPGEYVGLYHVNTANGNILANSYNCYCYLYCSNSSSVASVFVCRNFREGRGNAPSRLIAPVYYELYGGNLTADRHLAGGYNNCVSVDAYNYQNSYVAKNLSGTTYTAATNPITLPSNPTHPDGLTFAGWYLDEYYTTPATNQNLAVLTDGQPVTIYAKWTSKYPISLLEGASVRTNDPSGLRFSTQISETTVNALQATGKAYKVGTILVPTDRIDGYLPSQITLETLDGAGISYMKLESNLEGYTAKGGNYVFNAVISNILPANYARPFSAISYVVVGEGDDAEYYYGAYDPSANSRSVFQVLKAAISDRSGVKTGEYIYSVGGQYSPYSDWQRTVISTMLARVAEVSISGSSASLVAVNGYSNPYSVSLSGSTLTITGSDVSNIGTVIVNGKPYTGGWTMSGNTLTATISK